MKYYLYIDESGDHGLTTLNQDFPVFLLCGVIISATDYEEIRKSLNVIKRTLWGNKEVIFHSRDIRKCEKEFSILFDMDKKKWFYDNLNNNIQSHNYAVIASAIQKDKYIKRVGLLSNDVYELALSFIIERAVFYLDDIVDADKELEIIIEKRGKKEDKKLEEHFQRLIARGTGFVSPKRLNHYKLKIDFKSKKENINGLQLADLIAYPIARYVIEPGRANPAFDQVEPKIYSKKGKRYGLKIFP
ncbi:MAG: DUF3800 domain-containing protein [Bacteroidales bacterium]|nr:DUF3800 domain-containing protein [Bacteroidales bacterium]